MKQYLTIDPWRIIEDGFHPEFNRISESIFSIGNGRMGQRANFEEQYSGDSLQGSYIAGLYYPDKTRVGWWKNGYPEYFAKVINATNWIGLDITLDGIPLDLAKATVLSFQRVLDMKNGLLERRFVVRLPNKLEVQVDCTRFCSLVDDEIGAVRYSITPLNLSPQMVLNCYLDADVSNQDSNYDEKFWEEVQQKNQSESAYLQVKTKKLNFHLCSGMRYAVFQDEYKLDLNPSTVSRNKYIGHNLGLSLPKGTTTTIYKFVSNVSSLNYEAEDLMKVCKDRLIKAYKKGFQQMQREQAQAWKKKWSEGDIVIEGDAAAQQAIRFNIFQLHQTYTGEDERLNIGPKGFTGEKYGGSTYWDTEAYCLWFYLATAPQRVGRNLLLYRYKHLSKAIENAQKLGFNKGAALYPMVTMNGEECHNEWEITFEEIHRNGAIAYAIYNYVQHTNDKQYLADYGLEVLIALARFWAQRVNYSPKRQKFVILGVTGPNEYENNINNNWYTNLLASWTLRYTREVLEYVKEEHPIRYAALIGRTDLDYSAETRLWDRIEENMYFPKHEELGIFLQQDGYFDKEQIMAADIPTDQIPIWQHWSWDRILRSCFIKQADTLMAFLFFEEDYDQDTIRKNFEFYEPRTVHDSSLSPCVHAVLAARLGMEKKAYEMYQRAARLDLDDYNNDTEDGLHITAMAGTWMSVVMGFGGMRIRNGQLNLSPMLPEKWEKYSFQILLHENPLRVEVSKKAIRIINLANTGIEVVIKGESYQIKAESTFELSV